MNQHELEKDMTCGGLVDKFLFCNNTAAAMQQLLEGLSEVSTVVPRLQSFSQIPRIIGLSADVDGEVTNCCLSAGMTAVLSKPCSRGELWRAISCVVDSSCA